MQKTTGQSSTAPLSSGGFRVHFGGPDRPARHLRDLLEQRIAAVPPGGEILWVTYYFLDEGLAGALVKARRRGVRVEVLLEAQPRSASASSAAGGLLAGPDALGSGLRLIRHTWPDNHQLRRGRLHEKMYYFSHPAPHALVGSFNPSGNGDPGDPILAEIGDQDHGHNVLVEIRDPGLAAGLLRHGRRLHRMPHGPWERFLPAANRPLLSPDGTQVIFLPRLRVASLFGALFGTHRDHRLRIAVSHLNHPGVCRHLRNLAETGTRIEILAHDTRRRVPAWVEERLRHPRVEFRRYHHPAGWPMHNKFILSETPIRRQVAFGSLNLSRRSLHANHEILVLAEDPTLFRAFSGRWAEMWNEPASRCARTGPGFREEHHVLS